MSFAVWLTGHSGSGKSAIARFAEVYVDTPLDVCRAREPKGLYRQGMQIRRRKARRA